MKIAKFLSVLVAALSFSLGVGRAADIYWTNTLGGSWGDVVNWSPNQVPGASDNAFITAGGTYDVHITGSDFEVNDLTVGGPSGTQRVGIVFWFLTAHGKSVFATNTVLVLGSDIRGTGIIIHGRMDWLYGGVSGVLTIATNGVLDLSGGYGKRFNGILTNVGTVAIAGPGSLNIGGFNSRIYNQPGGLFDLQTNGVIDSHFTAAFYNAGRLLKSAGSGRSLCDVMLYNTGTIEVQSGDLAFNYWNPSPRQLAGSILLNGGSLTCIFGDPIEIFGGLLQGSGQVNSSVHMSGQLSPGLSAGWLYVGGEYRQTVSGSYNVEIGGTVAGTNYDQVEIASNAVLSGSINVCSINGFAPALGDQFEIMKFASMSGSVNFVGLDITNGIYLQPIFSPTNLVLVATNAPLSASPKLNLARNGDDLWLWWPLGYGGFNVVSTTNLTAPISWSPVTPADINRHTFTPTGPTKLFRMIPHADLLTNGLAGF